MVMQARRSVDLTNEAVGAGQWLRDIPAEQVEASEPHTQILHELRAESCGGGMDFAPHYVIFGGTVLIDGTLDEDNLARRRNTGRRESMGRQIILRIAVETERTQRSERAAREPAAVFQLHELPDCALGVAHQARRIATNRIDEFAV